MTQHLDRYDTATTYGVVTDGRLGSTGSSFGASLLLTPSVLLDGRGPTPGEFGAPGVRR